VRVERRRGEVGEEKLDQGEAAVARLSRYADDREGAEEPESLAISRGRPRWFGCHRGSMAPEVNQCSQP
jgi:hypothetical protein